MPQHYIPCLFYLLTIELCNDYGFYLRRQFTVALALWFIVLTLKPEWIAQRGGAHSASFRIAPSGVTLSEAPPGLPATAFICRRCQTCDAVGGEYFYQQRHSA